MKDYNKNNHFKCVASLNPEAGNGSGRTVVNLCEVFMEYQQAIVILQNLLGRYPLEAEEKEAVTTAIGLLSWGMLGKSRLKNIRQKREKHSRAP
jgi:hypothetical protein